MNEETFENFKPVLGAEKALAYFKELVASPGWFMLLCYGFIGNGKTHLCNALASELQKKGRFCRVMDWSETYTYLEYTKRVKFQEGDLYHNVSNRLNNAPILILDDLDIDVDEKGYKQQEEWNYFEDLIKYRYKHNLFTVVTTNLDLKQLPPRIVSRFSDAVKSRKVLNKAVDYRPLKVKEDAI